MIIPYSAFSDEGMWIPLLVEKLNITDMQEKGLQLSAEDIYSVNKACLANAVVLFGRGCTGEVISSEGLVLTNYHCGFSRIQIHSSVERDYLTEGYWAYSKDKELPNGGLTVSFLKYMKDVTAEVLAGTESLSNEDLIRPVIVKNIREISAETIEGTHLKAEINSFFYGKNYYLFVYEVFRDIRLVGAPPSSIGKFGGDTDNWVWPRHTGDFALFRIYADSLNNPADFSPENVPYKPSKYFDISVKGVKEGDFTMVLGYPAKTEQYLISDELKLLSEKSLPKKIEVRETRLKIMDQAMQKNDTTRIKYADKYAGVSNAWKKWVGVMEGFNKFGVIHLKEKEEAEFINWLNKNETYRSNYGNILPDLKKIYLEIADFYIANDFGYEAVMGTEAMNFVSKFLVLLTLDSKTQKDEINKTIAALKNQTNGFFKNYDISVDKQVFPRMLELYYENVDSIFHPALYQEIKTKYNRNFDAYANHVFSNSVFVDKNKLLDLLNDYNKKSEKKIFNDPLLHIFNSFSTIFYFTVNPEFERLSDELDQLYSKYIEALFVQYPDSLFYPDANFTMRVAYGNVKGYSPFDAVNYSHSTTLKGVIEKENPEVYDYIVPEKLKSLYYNKDFGTYGMDTVMPLSFIATNHTSGGNSGSPVLNAKGQLIGINFDRNWEGTMSDYNYDLAVCRNITLDIRYVLFIIDKFAGATNIIEELNIAE